MQAALAGGKAKKKKWNKGKMREKINAKVLFDEDGWNRLQAEVPKVNQPHIICHLYHKVSTLLLTPGRLPLSYSCQR